MIVSLEVYRVNAMPQTPTRGLRELQGVSLTVRARLHAQIVGR